MIRVACIGAGYFSRYHLRGWELIQNAECVGVADHDLAAAQATGHPAFDRLDQMLDQTRPDLLDVILPPAAQAHAIATALDAGVKTIICQKPFGTSLAQAEALTSQAETAGSLLIIHENFRFQPWYRTLKSMMVQGHIGDPLQATFRLRPGDGLGPDAYLARQPYFQQMKRFLIHETGVHMIDTFRYLFGDPSAVYADLRRVNPVIAGEDAGFVVLDHPKGLRGLIDGNRSLDHAALNTRCTMGEGVFEGTNGAITLAGDGSLHLRKRGRLGFEQVHPPDTSGQFGGDCARHLQAHVIAALTDGAPLENTARAYLTVLRLEELIYKSAETGQKQQVPA